MLTVKKMHPDGLEDSHPNKAFSLIPLQPGETLRFEKGKDELNAECQCMVIERPKGPSETHCLGGKVYVLSDSGKTIASHGF